MMRRIVQSAPWPVELEEIIQRFRYRPGWQFILHEDFVRDREDPADPSSAPSCSGTTLDIITQGYNSYHPERGETYRVHHYKVVPAAEFNRESWMWWLLQMCFEVEQHETCEFFALNPMEQGEHEERPFRPVHAPGWNPYMLTAPATEQARRTSYKGQVNP